MIVMPAKTANRCRLLNILVTYFQDSESVLSINPSIDRYFKIHLLLFPSLLFLGVLCVFAVRKKKLPHRGLKIMATYFQ